MGRIRLRLGPVPSAVGPKRRCAGLEDRTGLFSPMLSELLILSVVGAGRQSVNVTPASRLHSLLDRTSRLADVKRSAPSGPALGEKAGSVGLQSAACVSLGEVTDRTASS